VLNARFWRRVRAGASKLDSLFDLCLAFELDAVKLLLVLLIICDQYLSTSEDCIAFAPMLNLFLTAVSAGVTPRMA
jgi:hypothetical protein